MAVLEQSLPHGDDNEAYMVKKTRSLRARYVYGFIFLSTNLLAWFVRDYGCRVLMRLQPTRVCEAQEENFFHVSGVLRVSLGCFIFFICMIFTTFGARNLNQARNAWHSGWWTLKFFLYLMSIIAAYVIPVNFIHIYGEVARMGAG
ncbi:membrane protein TMS1-like [Phalaenopsis equestris]|uniref:membrane protein TMS1-like n=1 Tax=Phalaenopsis equestris TaxID=78828 RepID=UPI0009E52500|nr:membrane protein TMS1-like [Phalaenopsis equestris]